MESKNILEVKGLHTYFYLENKVIKAVEGVSFNLKKGEVLGLVGESGCGKSVTAYSLLKLVGSPGKIESGRIIFDGKDVLSLGPKELTQVRGKKIGFVFQEPHSALNPVYNVEFQISETIKGHEKESKAEIKVRVLKLLESVGIKNPESKLRSYPHNLSGGEAQRVMVAQCLSCNPEILIADEPTTALDVTVQAKIIELFKSLKNKRNLSMIFITHDLALCSQIADRMAVMYAGEIVEIAGLSEIINNPVHPYTKALFASLPQKNREVKKLAPIKGEVPAADKKPQGCFFHPRCDFCQDVCGKRHFELKEKNSGHWVRCRLALD